MVHIDDPGDGAQTLGTSMYQQPLNMGSSIGRQDLADQSGTAGGVVKLSNGGEYALTNHHVASNDSLNDREWIHAYIIKFC